ALLVSGIGINCLIHVNPLTAIIEIGSALLLAGTLVCLRRGHYTTASNLTIAVLLVGLGMAGFLGYSGEVVLDAALLNFNLIPVMFYACLIGTRRYQPLGALVICLLLNTAYLVGAVNAAQWILDPRLAALFVNATVIISVAGAMAYHILNMNTQLVHLAEEEAANIRSKTDEMQRTEEWLRVTLHSIGDGVITTSLDRRVTMMNRVAERLTGWSADEAIGRSIDEIFCVVDEFTRQPCESPVQKALDKNTTVELASHSILIARDGTERAVTDSGAPIRDPLQITIGVVLVFRDETEKRNIETSLRNTERLESLGALAGGLAHDFNNLLCGMFGFIELASAQADQPDEVRQCLGEASEVFDRARGLTQQLLTFAKGGTPERQPTDMQVLLKQSVTFALSGSNVAPRFDIADDLWPCDVDRRQLSQAIGDLTSNGQQSMPDGGALTVSARNWPEDGPLPFGLPKGDYLKLSIADSGTGIPKHDLPHIFDPFFTTKEQGHGLGLAMVHSVIVQHGGDVTVTSQQNQGSSFTLYLPASERPRSEIDDTRTQEIQEGSGHILFVDDEDTNIRVAAGMLNALGYQTSGAHNEQEALHAFQKAHDDGAPFKVAILDLTIQGGPGGKEIARQLRDQDPALKIIATSGYSHDPILVDPAAFGFDDRLHKPFRLADLSDVLARVQS
ncbi:MAG: PAS domain S-box protein, partial [Verrucomicrobia bacterium]|nr:PAS domain S-box protein [Verrucomicrobiota bacterium]